MKFESWSDKTAGNVNFQLALAREILHQLEIANDFRVLTVGGMWLKTSLKKHSLALASLNQTIARSCSRISWLQEGDANTKLFHLHAPHCKRKNFIAKLTSGGNIYMGHEDKAQVVDQFYDELLERSINREHTINLHELGIPSQPC
jgi:hypothetical protein